VREATLYPWCSAARFARQAEKPFYETVMRTKSDAVRVRDDFDVDLADIQ
jgi:hypothetical protein